MILEDEQDIVRSYLSYGHQINYEDYTQQYHIKNYDGDFIPHLLSKLGKVVIDIVRHEKIGTIYLPLEMTLFQKDFVLSRSSAFSKREWSMYSIQEDEPIIIDYIDFSEIEKEINKKQIKKIS